MRGNDGYSIHDYGRMIADTARSEPYVEALRRVVRPESTLLDIGTGPGFFALLACRLGARRVYALETDASIAIGQECARLQGDADRIVWIRDLSTQLDLPERVDVCIGDLHGTFPFYSGNLVSLIDARRRHLKPQGTLIPSRDIVYAVPAEAADEYAGVVDPWETRHAGIDLSPGRRYVVNQWWRAATPPISADRYLASPQAWADIDYRTVDSAHVAGGVDWVASRPGVMHGYYLWFDGETGDGLRFSNAPTLPERVYGRAFLPLERPVTLGAGDRIRGEFSANLVADEYVLRWKTSVNQAGGGSVAKFDQSDFASRPRSPEDVQATRPDHRPVLQDRGRADLLVLQGMSGGRSLMEIARRLADEFPTEFGAAGAALRHVADLSLKYGKR